MRGTSEHRGPGGQADLLDSSSFLGPAACRRDSVSPGGAVDVTDGYLNDHRGEGAVSGAHVSTQHEAPDGGWGWVVLTATIMVMALTLAFPSCIGIFYTDLQNEFSASNTEMSWVPAIMTAMLHAGGPLCSVMVEQFGCRVTVMIGGVLSGVGMVTSSFTRTMTGLYITAGIVTGLGFCFSFQPAVTIMGHYFVRRRAFANAISSTGTAIGLSVLPLFSHFLLGHLGWRGSFLVLGGMLFNCCVCGAVMRPVGGSWAKRPGPEGSRQHNSHPAAQKEKESMRSTWSLIKGFLQKHMALDLFRSNLRYRTYTIGVTWMMLGFLVPIIYLVPYATTSGMTHGQAALLLAILGFTNIFVRPLAALLFRLPWFQGQGHQVFLYTFATALLINGLSNLICCLAASFPVLLAFILLYGMSISVVGSLLFTVLMSIVEMNRFPAALGLLTVMESVTILLGPPLAGLLVDSTGHYTYVFYACAASVCMPAVFLMVAFYWLDRVRERTTEGQPGLNRTHLPKPAIILSPDCKHSSGPVEGGKSPGVESLRVTSV